MKAIDWINHLNMSRHPEGGYYKEIFRSEKLVDNDKSAMTSFITCWKMKINQLSID
ncbi:MAG: cupin domain-containing protein [Bacteroides cellulosilyticus]